MRIEAGSRWAARHSSRLQRGGVLVDESGGDWLVSGRVCVSGGQFVPVPVLLGVQFGSFVLSGVAVVSGLEVVPRSGAGAVVRSDGPSARRIVPLSSSPECVLAQPESAMPAAAASAIQ